MIIVESRASVMVLVYCVVVVVEDVIHMSTQLRVNDHQPAQRIASSLPRAAC